MTDFIYRTVLVAFVETLTLLLLYDTYSHTVKNDPDNKIGRIITVIHASILTLVVVVGIYTA